MFDITSTEKNARQALREDGFSLLTPQALLATLNLPLPLWHTQWIALTDAWNRLPPDAHLKDGGRYRQRRHACYVQQMDSGALIQTPHRPHWQATDYNALHGGFNRWFEPVELPITQAPAWRELIAGFGKLFADIQAVPRWYVEAHQFRIDTTGGVGRPTPEGAHRDGVNFVVVLLVARHEVKGGETRVFDTNSAHGIRFVMQEPLTALLLDDARMIHETTPIRAIQEHTSKSYRDTLVLTYRADGFQAP